MKAEVNRKVRTFAFYTEIVKSRHDEPIVEFHRWRSATSVIVLTDRQTESNLQKRREDGQKCGRENGA